jgi:hypothetical protein
MNSTFLPKYSSLGLTRQGLKLKPIVRKPIQAANCSLNVSLITECIPHSIVASSAATISKFASFCVTYPLESCKLYLQLDKRWTSIFSLYNGFLVICVTFILQQFIHQNIFYGILQSRQLINPLHHAVLEATIGSCVLSSFSKAPLVFLGRNMVFTRSLSVVDAFFKTFQRLDFETYKKCWITTLICDMPDNVIRFALNYIMLLHFPGADHFLRNLLVGVISSIIGAPLDFLVTRTACQRDFSFRKDLRNDIQKNLLNKCFNGLKYKVGSVIIGNVIFSSVFSRLQPCKYY